MSARTKGLFASCGWGNSKREGWLNGTAAYTVTSTGGRRALVTGAGRGIGLACAAALAQAGAHVVLAARTTSETPPPARDARPIQPRNTRALEHPYLAVSCSRDTRLH